MAALGVMVVPAVSPDSWGTKKFWHREEVGMISFAEKAMTLPVVVVEFQL